MGARRNFVHLVHEDRPATLEALDYVAIVNDLLTDVDRRPEAVERALDDVHRAVYTGAPTPGSRKQDGAKRPPVMGNVLDRH
jgi:hypothetical protein